MILFAFPNDELYNRYFSNKDIIYLCNDGWHLYDENKKVRVFYLFEILYPVLEDLDFINIKNQLSWWSPIFNRWASYSFKYEDYRVDSINIILKLYSGLVKFKITKVVNFTAIPHHIDSLLLSIAAKASSCEELHLYANVFDGRLLPISHTVKDSCRSTTTVISSKIDYTSILKEFISNKSNGNPPKLNTKISSFKKN